MEPRKYLLFLEPLSARAATTSIWSQSSWRTVNLSFGMTVYVDDMKADFLPNHAPGRRYVKHHRTDQQWKPETTDRGWHWLRRRDSLEWRLAFRDRLEVGWRVSDLIGRTVAMSCGKVGRFSAYHGPVQRPEPRGPPRDEAALARGA